MTRLTAAVLVVPLLAAVAIPTPALAAPAEEAEILDLVNVSRAGRDLPPLARAEDLEDDARAHTAAMVTAGAISHSTPGELARATTGWELLGENVGYGPDPRSVHRAFLRSETHRDNVFGEFDAAAIGTARSADGTLFVTVVFVRRGAQPAREDDDPAVDERGAGGPGPLVRAAVSFPAAVVARTMSLARSLERPPPPVCGGEVVTSGCVD